MINQGEDTELVAMNGEGGVILQEGMSKKDKQKMLMKELIVNIRKPFNQDTKSLMTQLGLDQMITEDLTTFKRENQKKAVIKALLLQDKAEGDTGGISLNTMIDITGKQVIVLRALVENVSDGHKIIISSLGTLRALELEDEEAISISINLGNGLLYEKDNEDAQTKVLEDILDIRGDTVVGSPAHGSITNMLKHPIMVSFIREKWQKVRRHFSFHLRYWILFTLTFSLFLRVEINVEMARKQFLNHTTLNQTQQCAIVELEEFHCVSFDKSTENLTLKNCTNETIFFCHPEELIKDKSVLFMYGAIGFIIIWWLYDVFIGWRRKAPWTLRIMNSVTALFSVILIIIAINVDRQDVRKEPFSPFTEVHDGFIVLEVLLVTMAFYQLLIREVFLIIIACQTGKLSDYTKDPVNITQLFALVATLISVFGQESITEHGTVNAIAAIGITFAWISMVIKIGQSSLSFFGNFVTLFHVILRKIPYYFMALLLMLIGFSYGFWVLERSFIEEKKNFPDFGTSVVSVFVMSLGEFNFNDLYGEYDGHTSMLSTKITAICMIILLLVMILFVCLGMLNLFLAIIIKGHRENREEVFTQNLIFMARYSITIQKTQTLFSTMKSWWPRVCSGSGGRESVESRGNRTTTTPRLWWLWRSPSFQELDGKVKYCPRELCFLDKLENHPVHLENEFQWMLTGLKACVGYKEQDHSLAEDPVFSTYLSNPK
jgi:hypothetical protein